MNLGVGGLQPLAGKPPAEASPPPPQQKIVPTPLAGAFQYIPTFFGKCTLSSPSFRSEFVRNITLGPDLSSCNVSPIRPQTF